MLGLVSKDILAGTLCLRLSFGWEEIRAANLRLLDEAVIDDGGPND
jgi:hypothetical protein